MVPSPDENRFHIPELSNWQSSQEGRLPDSSSIGSQLIADRNRLERACALLAKRLGFDGTEIALNGPNNSSLRRRMAAIYGDTAQPLVALAIVDKGRQNVIYAAFGRNEDTRFVLPGCLSPIAEPRIETLDRESAAQNSDRVVAPHFMSEVAHEEYVHPAYLLGYQRGSGARLFDLIPEISLSPDAIGEGKAHFLAAQERISERRRSTGVEYVTTLPPAIFLRVCLSAIQYVLPPEEQLLGVREVEDVSAADCVITCATGRLENRMGICIVDPDGPVRTRRAICYYGVRPDDGRPYAHAELAA